MIVILDDESLKQLDELRASMDAVCSELGAIRAKRGMRQSATAALNHAGFVLHQLDAWRKTAAIQTTLEL